MTTTDPTKPHICTPNCEPGCAHAAAAVNRLLDRLGITEQPLTAALDTLETWYRTALLEQNRLKAERDAAQDRYRRLAEAMEALAKRMDKNDPLFRRADTVYAREIREALAATAPQTDPTPPGLGQRFDAWVDHAARKLEEVLGAAPMTTDDKTPMLKAAVEATSQAIRQALDGPSAATGRPPRASEITLADVMDRIDVTAVATMRAVDTIAGALNAGAPGWSQEMAAENARLRSQLAEALEALVRAETERDEARQQWSIEIGLRQALGANYDALRAEVQSIADACREMSERPIGAEVPERLAHVAGPYRIAESLRAAFGSTPDTGSTT